MTTQPRSRFTVFLNLARKKIKGIAGKKHTFQPI